MKVKFLKIYVGRVEFKKRRRANENLKKNIKIKIKEKQNKYISPVMTLKT